MVTKPSTQYARSVNLLHFFGLTYLLSWLIWIPLALSHFNVGSLHIPEETSSIVRLLGVLMPAVAALILTRQAGGGAAIRKLLSRLTAWRVGWKWWAAAALVQPVLLILAFLIYNSFWDNLPVSLNQVGTASAFIVNVVFLLIATLGEEIGWRGVALPGLQAKQSPLYSSILLGLLWGAWHIPFWFLLDTFDQFGFGYLALNFLFGIPLTIYITWVFNHSRSSLLLVVVIHVTFNIINTILLPVTTNFGAFGLLVALEWLVALLVVRHLKQISGG